MYMCTYRLSCMHVWCRYVFYIRRARNFLYVENQYFIGSSFLWKHDRAWSCFHIIPAEILAKIVSKIRRRERFTAYIVIPLHPEGPPVRPLRPRSQRSLTQPHAVTCPRCLCHLLALPSDA